MDNIVNAEAVPKTLTEKLMDLEVGQALVVNKKLRATALGIIYYQKHHKGKSFLRFKSRKKNDEEVYIIREA